MEFIDNSDGHPYPDVDPFTLLEFSPLFEVNWDGMILVGKWKACKDAPNTAWRIYCSHYDGTCTSGPETTTGNMWVYIYGNDAGGSGYSVMHPGGMDHHFSWGDHL